MTIDLAGTVAKTRTVPLFTYQSLANPQRLVFVIGHVADIFDIATVGIHDIDLTRPIAVGHKGKAGAIGRPGDPLVPLPMVIVDQVADVAAISIDQPDVVAAGILADKGDGVAIGRPLRVVGNIL